jgi:AcrR family transcriptional regulator
MRRGGVEAVAVEAIAVKLGVTKGSFYWHFRDRSDLLEGLLRCWEEETHGLILAAGASDKPLERVLRFFEMVATNRGQIPDTEFFAWARHDPNVARRAAEIESQRIDFIQAQLQAAGVRRAEAARRAEAGYLATLGWIERSDRPDPKRSPSSFRQFTNVLFGWLFEGIPSARRPLHLRASRGSRVTHA